MVSFISFLIFLIAGEVSWQFVDEGKRDERLHSLPKEKSLIRMPCDFFSHLCPVTLETVSQFQLNFREGMMFQGISDATGGSDFACYLETTFTVCIIQ